MNKKTIITGPAGSGKTDRAEGLAAGRKAVFIDHHEFKVYGDFVYAEVTNETELIVIDGIPKGEEGLQFIKGMITCKGIHVNKKMQHSFEMDMPDLILVTQGWLPKNMRLREETEIILCKSYDSIARKEAVWILSVWGTLLSALCFTVFAISGCETKSDPGLGSEYGELHTYRIDGCEYIGSNGSHGTSHNAVLTHKGNCDNPIHQYNK